MNRRVDGQKRIQCAQGRRAREASPRDPGQRFSSDVKAKPNELTS